MTTDSKLPPVHRVRKRSQRVRADFSFTIASPKTKSGTIKCYALVPPDIATQTLLKCTIRCREVPDLDMVPILDSREPKRRYLLIDIPVWPDIFQNKSITVDIIYELDLYKVSLQPDAAQEGAHTLPASELKTCLEATDTMDYNTPEFKNYLKTFNLIKAEEESHAGFAYRAFQIISHDLAGRVVPDAVNGYENMKASVVCRRDMRDGGCGNCAVLFTAAMRANGIPSRLLVGRWAKNEENGYGQFHVRSDFFDPQVGWCPVDQTFGWMAIKRGDTRDSDFGLNMADFITFHVNSDLAPAGIEESTKLTRVHQFAIIHYVGTSHWDNKGSERWMVTPISRPREGDLTMIEDFENGYANWTGEGRAFGIAPARGPFANQQKFADYDGAHLVNTYIDGDAPQGWAESAPFVIKQPFIRFLIGGGEDEERLAFQLVVDGKVVRSATGDDDECLLDQEWDVSDLRGRTAKFRIIDQSSDGWGHILVDGIAYADKAMPQDTELPAPK